MAKKSTVQTVGKNVEYAIEGDKLTLTIDLNAQGTPSKSGKTQIIGTTGGNKALGDVMVGLNVYRYLAKKGR